MEKKHSRYRDAVTCVPFKTFFRTMKLTLFVVLLSTIQILANSVYSQSTKFTLDRENVTIENVLGTIEDQSEFYFLYNGKLVDVTQKVNIKVEKQNLENTLNELLRNTNITYNIYDRQVVLSPVGAGETIQQQKSVSGKVTDSTGSPLPGVSVVIKGTTTGTITDGNGNFSLSNIPENATLQFSFVGMKGQEVAVAGKTIVNIKMDEETIGMDEVMVIGYGTQKKKNLTGSISSIKTAQLTEVPASTLEQAFQGNVPGVMVSQTGGAPGAALSVRVRGIGSINGSVEPLYVVDGVPIENTPIGGGGDYQNPDVSYSPLSAINPGDIESIEILKDASATAIYGARGANGVVLITTKRGKSGKTKITYDAYFGIQEPANTLEVLNAQQYMELQNEFAVNDGRELPYPDIESTVNRIGEGTNWQEELYKTGLIQNHQISLNGGAEKTKFFASLNYFNQEGIVDNNGFERYTFRTNLDHTISKKISTGFSLNISNSNINNLPSGVSGGNVFRDALSYSPLYPIKSEEGEFSDYLDANTGVFVNNPIGLINEVTNKTKNFRPTGNAFLNIFLLENLNFKTTIGLDARTQRDEVYVPRTVQRGKELGGRAVISYQDRSNIVIENTANYRKLFESGHNFDFLAGQMVQTASSTTRRFGAQNFPNDVLGANVLENGATQELPISNLSKWAIISYLGRFNYSFKEKYLATFTVRADGSSRFGTNKRFGVFPSGALAWRFIEEDFMQSLKMFSDGKLRFSYGINGNQDGIGTYDRFARLAAMDYSYPIGPGNTVVQGFAPVAIPNNNLGWEETKQYNIGLNLGFFNNRIVLEADYFQKNTTKLLFNVPLPQSAYVGSDVIRNIGELNNSGVELMLNTTNVSGSNFSWETSLNISFIDNEIVSLPNGKDITYISLFGATNIGLLREGANFPSFYGWISDGIFADQEEVNNHTATTENGETKLLQPLAKPGDVKYRDISGPDGIPDGTIGTHDRTVIGSALPDFYGGIRNSFSYKNLDLSFFINFSYGNDIVNYNRWTLANVNRGANQLTEVLNRWTPLNTETNVPAARSSRSTEYAIDSRFVEDGSFIRMRDVTLSYKLPKDILPGNFISNAKLYIRGNNLFTITRYKGVDPESNSFSPNSSQLAGIEVSVYPMVRMYTFGINVQF